MTDRTRLPKSFVYDGKVMVLHWRSETSCIYQSYGSHRFHVWQIDLSLPPQEAIGALLAVTDDLTTAIDTAARI
jgi:hypothetical protein